MSNRLLTIWCGLLTLVVIGQTILLVRQHQIEQNNLALITKAFQRIAEQKIVRDEERDKVEKAIGQIIADR